MAIAYYFNNDDDGANTILSRGYGWTAGLL